MRQPLGPLGSACKRHIHFAPASDRFQQRIASGGRAAGPKEVGEFIHNQQLRFAIGRIGIEPMRRRSQIVQLRLLARLRDDCVIVERPRLFQLRPDTARMPAEIKRDAVWDDWPPAPLFVAAAGGEAV